MRQNFMAKHEDDNMKETTIVESQPHIHDISSS